MVNVKLKNNVNVMSVLGHCEMKTCCCLRLTIPHKELFIRILMNNGD